jgi:transcriptional regulator with XRE-family HTH domain
MQLHGPLNTYVRNLRARAGLSQNELATLLGSGGHSTVSAYEQEGQSQRDVERVIALELILDEPVQAIFAGISKRLREQIARRASAVLAGVPDKTSRANVQKLETLARLAHIDKEQDDSLWNGTV